MTSAPGLKLLLGHPTMLRCQILRGTLGEHAVGGTHRDGCGHGRKSFCQLTHATSCRFQFGTELWRNMVL
eukprot:1136988-Pelagomonas_calceolata.AAC.8